MALQYECEGPRYGAQKVFLCNQRLFGDCSPESVLELNREVAEVEKRLPTVRGALGKGGV